MRKLIPTNDPNSKLVFKKPTNHPKATRLTVLLTPEQHRGFNRVPWGLRSQLLSSLVTDINKMMDVQGASAVIARIIDKKLTVEEVLKSVVVETATEIAKEKGVESEGAL